MPWSVFSSAGSEKVLTTVAAGSVKLFDQTLTADTATIDTGAIIPPDYDVLEIWLMGRTDEAAVNSTVSIQFNGDTSTADYIYELVRGNNTTASAVRNLTIPGIQTGIFAGASHAANHCSVHRLTIPSYDQTNFYKIVEMVNGAPDASTAGSNYVEAEVGMWLSTAAINRVTAVISSGSSQKFKAGTRLIIFGRGSIPYGGGGAIKQSYIGTTGVGGTTDALGTGSYKQIAKQVTLATPALLSSIDTYLKGDAAHVQALGVAVMDDNAGVPGKAIALSNLSEDTGSTLNVNAVLNATQRWVSVPVGIWLPTGTYWLFVNTGNNSTLYYDATGSDYTATGAQTWFNNDSGGLSNATRTYSIRGTVVR